MTEAPTPNPGLRVLERMVGKWRVSGEAEGELTYEWLDGKFFLIAHGDFTQGGRHTTHIEIIGYEHALGSEPATEITSRLYTSSGDSLSYTHEFDDKGMTTWFGAKGAPTKFTAKWAGNDKMNGAWEWPGGGYTLTLTRIK
jgi:hypothetical protein